MKAKDAYEDGYFRNSMLQLNTADMDDDGPEAAIPNTVKINCATYPKPGPDNEIKAVPAMSFVKDG